MFKRFFALRRLAADVRRRKADNADFRRNRDAQLTPARKARIRELLR